jgi:hypothetical protein
MNSIYYRIQTCGDGTMGIFKAKGLNAGRGTGIFLCYVYPHATDEFLCAGGLKVHLGSSYPQPEAS